VCDYTHARRWQPIETGTRIKRINIGEIKTPDGEAHWPAGRDRATYQMLSNDDLNTCVAETRRRAEKMSA